MKKFFAWMKDTGGWAAYPALAIIIGLLVYMYASILFNLNNFYSVGVHAASGWWHVAGWVLTGVTIFVETKLQERGSIIFSGVLLALTFCAFAGFSF